MVQVPAGNFIMGSTGEEIAHAEQMARPYASAYNDFARDEWPPMLVYLGTFEIDQYEVTQARYQHCIMAGVCPPPYLWWNFGGMHSYEGTAPYAPYDDTDAALPVYVRRPTDAEAYCQWVGKRLPTEAEWEKAARGTDGRIYPWGNEWDAAKLQPADMPLPVGSYPAGVSPYGALDMAGNAPEWVGNQYSVYPGGHYTETAYFIDSKLGFVRRGGYFGNISTDSLPETIYRAANRFIGSNTTASGFRCLRGPAPLPLEKAVVSTMTIAQPPPATNVDLSKMVEIPAGEFQMGSTLISSSLHIVYLDSFYIDRYKTTNAEYVEFLNALGHIFSACGGITCAGLRPVNVYQYEFPSRILQEGERFTVEIGYESYPVAALTWEGADAYCRWRGKQLPTSAQWEKAARGPEGLVYPWGYKWEPNKCTDKPEPVGSDPSDVSPYGLFDVSCSVLEWMSDWYAPDYSYSPEENPSGLERPRIPRERVVRPHPSGGALDLPGLWQHDALSLTPVGVRCAYSPTP